MEERPHAILLKFPGTNCDAETERALRTVGFRTTVLPTSQLTGDTFADAHLVVVPGGFSYGDYVMAGRLAQLTVEQRCGDAIRGFIGRGGYAVGICNGFQILIRLGLLPDGTLIDNTNGRFICRWTGLENRRPDNVFLESLPEEFELPVAHAEGRFIAPDGLAQQYLDEGLAALTYTQDVNGSDHQIAGVQDKTGRVLGLMPHPERFLYRGHHYDPDWSGDEKWGWGYYFFKSIHDRIAAQ